MNKEKRLELLTLLNKRRKETCPVVKQRLDDAILDIELDIDSDITDQNDYSDLYESGD